MEVLHLPQIESINRFHDVSDGATRAMIAPTIQARIYENPAAI
jgi:hypothetical protein